MYMHVWPEILNRKYASTKRALWLKFVHVSVHGSGFQVQNISVVVWQYL